MIHIKELFRLQNINHLRLIAGQEGLERTVTAAVLFEYDPSRMTLPDFYRGDLVVTTLAYARGDAQLVSHSLRGLMNQGIAGLLVKTAYFRDLPADVIALAGKLGTPIFLFDDTYIEEVILQVTELIRGKRHFSGYEQDIDALMRGDLTEEQIRASAQRIDPVGMGRYRVYALLPTGRLPGLDEKLYALLCGDEALSHQYIFMEWKRMMLALCRADAMDGANPFLQMEMLLGQAQVDCEQMSIGVSRTLDNPLALGMALCEAAYAARAAKIRGLKQMHAEALGLYAYLFPMSENAYICDRCRRTLACIRDYDTQNHTSLEQTARVYVEQNMEIAAAAKALYQHPNTVRYRLSRIQHIMGMEDDPLFGPMISLAVNLSRILESDARG